MGPDPSDPKNSGPMCLGLGPGPNILGPIGPDPYKNIIFSNF